MNAWMYNRFSFTGPERGSRERGTRKRLPSSNLLVAFCANVVFTLQRKGLHKKVPKRLPKSDRTHERLPKGYERVTDSFITLFIWSTNTQRSNYGLEPLLRFPFSGPVNSATEPAKDHDTSLHYSPLLQSTGVRQVVSDK